MNTNRDYLADWCLLQAPVIGKDLNSGGGAIEGWNWDLKDGVLVKNYRNFRIRSFFFTPSEAMDYFTRAKADLGADVVTGMRSAANFDTNEDPLGRASYYLTIDGQEVPMNRLRYIASSGCDVNGKQVWSDKTHVIRVDGPGHFAYADGVLSFTPEVR